MPVITGLSLSEPDTQRVKEILDFLETAEHMEVFPTLRFGGACGLRLWDHPLYAH